jgi:hypothetical protein
MGVVTIVCGLLMIAAWWTFGALKAVRSRLSERFARWLLPDGQAVTFRVALALARLAETLTPGSVLANVGSGTRYPLFATDMRSLWGCPRLLRRPNTWCDPAGVTQELVIDLDSAAPVSQPIRLVSPVLRIAIGLRIRNLLQVGKSGVIRVCDSLEWVIFCTFGPLAVTSGVKTDAAMTATVLLFVGVGAEFQYQLVTRSSTDTAAGSPAMSFRARARWLIPVLATLLAVAAARALEGTLSFEKETFTGLVFLTILATLSIGFLIDCYYVLPRITVTERGATFGGRRASFRAWTVTRVLLLRSLLPRVLLIPLLTAYYLYLARSDPALQVWGWVLGGVFSLLTLITAISAVDSVRYALAPTYCIGDQIEVLVASTETAPFARASGQILEAIEITTTGILWAPVDDGNRPTAAPSIVGFRQLTTFAFRHQLVR